MILSSWILHVSSFLFISLSSVLILVFAIINSFFRNSTFTASGLGLGFVFLLFWESGGGAAAGMEVIGRLREGANVEEVTVGGVIVA